MHLFFKVYFVFEVRYLRYIVEINMIKINKWKNIFRYAKSKKIE